jgi:D-proline reductase (dithiol) PrdB
MVRLEAMNPQMAGHLENVPCHSFDTHPWVTGPSLSKRRVAVISTAGLHLHDDRPFTRDAGDLYRVIPGGVSAADLVMSHVSVNFDRSGFFQDWNVVFPIDRLRELAEEGIIGTVADFHYSFMGADDPMRWEQPARQLAGLLKKDRVDAVLLIPV